MMMMMIMMMMTMIRCSLSTATRQRKDGETCSGVCEVATDVSNNITAPAGARNQLSAWAMPCRCSSSLEPRALQHRTGIRCMSSALSTRQRAAADQPCRGHACAYVCWCARRQSCSPKACARQRQTFGAERRPVFEGRGRRRMQQGEQRGSTGNRCN